MTQYMEPTQLPLELQGLVLPGHVAVIMDGNGRWAKKQGWRRVRGHEEGAESVRCMVTSCRRFGIKALTLYAFSEENWGRPKSEVSALMKLMERFLKSERDLLIEKGIRLNTIGYTEKLPESTRKTLAKVMEDSADCKDMVLTIALSYGSRQEILRATRALAAKAAKGGLDPEAIDQAAFEKELFTSGLPDPDLIIRTSGEQRISNFLLWQMAYSEFYFAPAYWPDFREPQLIEALVDYAGRQRRYGKTGDQLSGVQE
jgi:undecaprenyl diphosphate synthase